MTESSIPAIALTAVAVAALLSLTCSSPPPPSTRRSPGRSSGFVRSARHLFCKDNRRSKSKSGASALPVRDEITVLRIGSREFLLSRYPETGDTHILIFTLSADEFAATTAGDPAVAQYGRGEQPDRWYLGRLGKAVR